MSEQHPLAKILAANTEITLGEQVVQVIELVDRRDGLVIYTVQNPGTRDHLLLKIASPSDDPPEYERWIEALENEGQVLGALRSANLADRHHLPLLHRLTKARIVEEGVEHIYPVALLTQLPQGQKVEQLLRASTALGEQIGLRIGCQVAQVMVLAHQEHYHCGAITPDQLFWDSVNQHAMVVDWYAAQQMEKLNLSESAMAERRQDDARRLALLIYWLATGHAQSTDARAIARHSDRLSVPLWHLLERAARDPASFGDAPLPRLAQDLARLLRYWDTPDLFGHVQQHIVDTPRQRQGIDLQTLQTLAEQVEIGRVKEPRHSWQQLTETSDELLAQPLEQIRQAIIAGNFGQALQQSRSLAIWPAAQRRLLWRQRVAEIGVADTRLATDQTLAQYRTSMGQAISAWDKGDYTIPVWLQQFGSLFTRFILAPAAQSVVQRLGYELQMADLIRQFEQTEDANTRLNAIETLEKMSLPEGIDTRLAEQRQHICQQRASVEEQHTRQLEKQQIEQRQAAFLPALQQLEQRVNNSDPTLASADFEQVLRLAPSSESRQKALDVQTIWNAHRFIRRLPEHGDVAEAVRNFVRLRHLGAAAHLVTEIEPFIAAEALRQFRLDGTAATLAAAFDHVLQQPKPSYDTLVQHRRWLHALLPALDAQRRARYDNLVKKETQVRKNLETLDMPVSLQEQTEALEQLREQGIVSLQHLYLRVLAQNRLQYEQEEYQTELVTLLEQTLSKVRDYKALRAAVPSSFGEDVAAIKQGIFGSKTSTARERHRALWEQASYFAPDYQELYYQHIYFTAQQAAAEFRVLWDADKSTPEDEPQGDTLARAMDTAGRLYRLSTILAESDYGAKVAAFIAEQRDQLNQQVSTLLRFDARLTPPEQRARSICKARRYLAIDAALEGHSSGTVALPDQSSISPLLAHRDPTVVRVALKYVPVDITENQVQRLLASHQGASGSSIEDEPLEPGQAPWQSRPLVFGALALIVVVLLIVALVSL